MVIDTACASPPATLPCLSRTRLPGVANLIRYQMLLESSRRLASSAASCVAVFVLWNLQGLILRANSSSSSAGVRLAVSGRTNQPPTALNAPIPLGSKQSRQSQILADMCHGQIGRLAYKKKKPVFKFQFHSVSSSMYGIMMPQMVPKIVETA
jgi:hypothetical protein